MKYNSLGDVLIKLINELGIEVKIDENKAIAYWSEVAGNQIAKNTEPDRIKDGILFVKVKSDVWRNELMFYKINLIKKLNQKIGKNIIFDIRFT